MSSQPRIGYRASLNNNNNNSASNDRLSSTKKQVEEMTVIMQKNVGLVLERDQKLSTLERNAEELNAEAGSFQKTSAKIKRWAWLKNMKWTIIIVLVVLLIIGAVVGVAVGFTRK